MHILCIYDGTYAACTNADAGGWNAGRDSFAPDNVQAVMEPMVPVLGGSGAAAAYVLGRLGAQVNQISFFPSLSVSLSVCPSLSLSFSLSLSLSLSLSYVL